MFKNQKKERKYGNKRNIYIKLHFKRLLWNEIHSLLRRADARAALTPFTVSDAYR